MTEKTIPWIDEENPSFPDVETAFTEPNGLLAAGGNLKPSTIIAAYSQGIFPWFNPGEPILWWSPNPRMVISPDQLHISRSLRKLLRKNAYHLTFDKAFNQVITECAKPRIYSEGTWITAAMKTAYQALHEQGHAHSVEIWEENRLVGGLYGVAIGQVFFGESMFSRVNNASKIAMAGLCHRLCQWHFQLFDCQVYSPHLESLGAFTIPRAEFVQKLTCYCQVSPSGANWRNDEWQWIDQSQ